jgi:hypothetical protein
MSSTYRIPPIQRAVSNPTSPKLTKEQEFEQLKEKINSLNNEIYAIKQKL